MGNFSEGVCGRIHLNQLIKDNIANGVQQRHVILDTIHWGKLGTNKYSCDTTGKVQSLTPFGRKQLENQVEGYLQNHWPIPIQFVQIMKSRARLCYCSGLEDTKETTTK